VPFRRFAPFLTLVLLLAALTAGCSSGGGADATSTGPTVPDTEATTTTAPAAADPYAIPPDPAKIDAAYLDGVLAALNHVYGAAARKRITTGRFEQTDLIPLRALYNDPEFAQQAEALAKTESPPADQLQSPIGDRRMTVKQILLAKQDCVALVVNYDFSAIRKDPPPVKDWYVTLEPHDPNTDPQHLNPTPWSFGYDGDTPVTSCAG
jgi:hypothetical protein